MNTHFAALRQPDKKYLPIVWSDPCTKYTKVIAVFQSHLPDSQTSLVCLSGTIFMQKMGMGYWWNDTDRENSVPAPIRPPLISHGVHDSDKRKTGVHGEKSLSERLLVHHKSPMDWKTVTAESQNTQTETCTSKHFSITDLIWTANEWYWQRQSELFREQRVCPSATLYRSNPHTDWIILTWNQRIQRKGCLSATPCGLAQAVTGRRPPATNRLGQPQVERRSKNTPFRL